MGYRIGSQPAVYALEGSIAIAGSLVQWVRDNMGLIKQSPDIEDLAKTVADNGGIYFVPAFSGLFAPHWRSERHRRLNWYWRNASRINSLLVRFSSRATCSTAS